MAGLPAEQKVLITLNLKNDRWHVIEIEDKTIIKFSSVQNALIWAVETASIPNVKSTSLFINVSKTGKAPRSDYIDLSLSILNRMNWIENKLQRDVLKFVYHGGSDALISLSGAHADINSVNPLFFYIALLNEYSRVWYGKEISNYHAEKIIGCKKGELRRYTDILRQTKRQIAETVQKAEIKMNEFLKEIDVI